MDYYISTSAKLIWIFYVFKVKIPGPALLLPILIYFPADVSPTSFAFIFSFLRFFLLIMVCFKSFIVDVFVLIIDLLRNNYIGPLRN